MPRRRLKRKGTGGAKKAVSCLITFSMENEVEKKVAEFLLSLPKGKRAPFLKGLIIGALSGQPAPPKSEIEKKEEPERERAYMPLDVLDGLES